MKTIQLLLIILFLGTANTISSQEALPSIYNLIDKPLTEVDTMPGFSDKANQLKLTGTVFLSDGVTPASDVLIVLSHADENGNYKVVETNGNKHEYHTAFVKTDANGNYTFYTFIPGSDRRFNQMKEMFLLTKVNDQTAQEQPTLMFDNDPLLTKRCRKRISKKSSLSRILKPKMVDTILEANYTITLKEPLK